VYLTINPADKILDYRPAGIVISNGPGDPSKCRDTIKSTKALVETSLPMMGMCLGTQILALLRERRRTS